MNFKDVFKISRPRFWLYTAGTYLIGFLSGASSMNGGIKSLLSIDFLLGFFIFLIPANIFLYGVNDYFDGDTDRYNAKKSEKEYFSRNDEKTNLIALTITSLVVFILGAFYIGKGFMYASIIFLLLSYYYSAPPLRFKSVPFIDAFSNFLYVVPGIAGYLMNGYIGKISIPLMISLLFWTAAMQIFSAIPDINADKKAKIKTTAVVLEERKGIYFCLGLWSLFSFFLMVYNNFLGFLSLIYPAIIIFMVSFKIPVKKMYWYYPYINAISGFVGFLYVVFYM